MDLISRQDAIDAYGDWYVEEGTAEGFIGTVKQLLEGLPSAQPEQQWIPCSERLPDMGFSVLVSVENEYFPYVAEALLEMDGTWTQFRWSAKLKAEDVIAWMPLPEPYMRGEEE